MDKTISLRLQQGIVTFAVHNFRSFTKTFTVEISGDLQYCGVDSGNANDAETYSVSWLTIMEENIQNGNI